MWLYFVINQTSVFNRTIEVMEKSVTTSFEASTELSILKSKIKNRMNLKFVPSAASDEMKLLTQNKQKEIQKEIQKF